MNSTVQTQSQPYVWLIVIDDKTWGYVSSSDDVTKIFKFLSDKFISDIKKVNPTFTVEAVSVGEDTIKIKCQQPGYVYNSSWTAHVIKASKVIQYSPDDNSDNKNILLPFPENSETAVEQKPESIQTDFVQVPLADSMLVSAVETPVIVEAKAVETPVIVEDKAVETPVIVEAKAVTVVEKPTAVSKPINIPVKAVDPIDELEKKIAKSSSPKKRQRSLPVHVEQEPPVKPVHVAINEPTKVDQQKIFYNLRRYPVNNSKKK